MGKQVKSHKKPLSQKKYDGKIRDMDTSSILIKPRLVGEHQKEQLKVDNIVLSNQLSSFNKDVSNHSDRNNRLLKVLDDAPKKENPVHFNTINDDCKNNDTSSSTISCEEDKHPILDDAGSVESSNHSESEQGSTHDDDIPSCKETEMRFSGRGSSTQDDANRLRGFFDRIQNSTFKKVLNGLDDEATLTEIDASSSLHISPTTTAVTLTSLRRGKKKNQGRHRPMSMHGRNVDFSAASLGDEVVATTNIIKEKQRFQYKSCSMHERHVNFSEEDEWSDPCEDIKEVNVRTNKKQKPVLKKPDFNSDDWGDICLDDDNDDDGSDYDFEKAVPGQMGHNFEADEWDDVCLDDTKKREQGNEHRSRSMHERTLAFFRLDGGGDDDEKDTLAKTQEGERRRSMHERTLAFFNLDGNSDNDGDVDKVDKKREKQQQRRSFHDRTLAFFKLDDKWAEACHSDDDVSSRKSNKTDEFPKQRSKSLHDRSVNFTLDFDDDDDEDICYGDDELFKENKKNGREMRRAASYIKRLQKQRASLYSEQ